VSAKKSARKSAKQPQTLDPSVFSIGNHYGFNGFPKDDWQSATNPALRPAVHKFHALLRKLSIASLEQN
jgi:hypothetical protein